MNENQSVIAAANQPPVQVAVVHPRDAVHWTLYYPAVIDFKSGDFACDDSWCAAARQSVGAWRRGALREAFAALAGVPENISDPSFLLYRGALRLSVGRVDAALTDLQQAQSSEVQRGDALALLAVTAVVQNKKEAARQLIDQAMIRQPVSSGVDMANAYVQQAFFDLDGAIASVRTATQKDPDNVLAWARLSELYLSRGERSQALRAAQRAAELQPELAHTMTVLGFAYLAQIKTEKAKQAFTEAIASDSAAPMARLGNGLAKIREGNLAEGRGEIEIAACLDPCNALIRSYLGKAYYEEKRDDPASVQLAAAKQLDPADPTPWYYDAIRKQTLNRPVEALRDLQQSIALNDNRAVYRSRLLLDEDLAARSAGIGRIYRDLGFQQLALVQGWKSVNADPSNYSAHRFLADSYSVLPRHEIARVSELLQFQLLQPININPVGPNLAESQSLIFEGTGPSSPSYNEFNPLFNRNRAAVELNVVGGEKHTFGNEMIFSGVLDRYSFSIGQFHYKTDGFRENNDLDQNIYNSFFQASLTPKSSIQAEVRSRDTESGDLLLLYDRDQFSASQRNRTDVTSFRLGGRHEFSTSSEIIASFINQDTEKSDNDEVGGLALISNKNNTTGYSLEIQHLFRKNWYSIVSGAGYIDNDSEDSQTIDFAIPILPDRTTVEKTTPKHGNAYLYSQFQVLEPLTLTGGLSYDDFDNDRVDANQLNPKLGVTWQPVSGTTFRGAIFRVLTRTLLNDQTVEPTQVAGFNQFYRDVAGADTWTYGTAVDQRLTDDVYGGLEISRRDLDIPFRKTPLPPQPPQVKETSWKEQLGRGYVYWAPHPWIVGNIEYLYERWERDEELGGKDMIQNLTTHRVGLGGSFFHPTGLFARIRATYADQEGDFWNLGLTSSRKESDNFWVVDGAVGYRLPKRFGQITVQVKNIFDEEFQFQDTDPANPTIYPERLALVSITLSF
jgi:tetratricopeptide (TPR) repeat protein